MESSAVQSNAANVRARPLGHLVLDLFNLALRLSGHVSCRRRRQIVLAVWRSEYWRALALRALSYLSLFARSAW